MRVWLRCALRGPLFLPTQPSLVRLRHTGLTRKRDSLSTCWKQAVQFLDAPVAVEAGGSAPPPCVFVECLSRSCLYALARSGVHHGARHACGAGADEEGEAFSILKVTRAGAAPQRISRQPDFTVSRHHRKDPGGVGQPRRDAHILFTLTAIASRGGMRSQQPSPSGP